MLNKFSVVFPLLIATLSITACSSTKPQDTSAIQSNSNAVQKNKDSLNSVPVVYEKRSPKKRVVKNTIVKKSQQSDYNDHSFAAKLSHAALERLRHRVRYDGKYVKIAYPWGDVPQSIGVCTDVVIRSYRRLGIDLQSQVHQDISNAFHTYPNPRKWGLSRPDTNIDHRRVYNLRNFFQRQGAALPVTGNPKNYKPGDLVTWMIGPDLPHIGIVVNKRSKADPNRFMIVHNIAHGPQMEDVLFRFPITGHYRYTPAHVKKILPKKHWVSNQYAPKKDRSLTIEELRLAAILLGESSTQQKQQNKNSPTIGFLQVADLRRSEAEALLSK